MKLTLAALLSLLLVASPRQEAEPPAPGPGLVPGAEPCGDCEGRGVRTGPCSVCHGTSRVACPRCDESPADRLRAARGFRLSFLAVLRPDQAERILEIAVEVLDLDIASMVLGGGAPKGIRPGLLACPKGCLHDPPERGLCRTCDGDSLVDCEGCDGAARIECPACEEGVAEEPCLPCRGHGQVLGLDALEQADVRRCTFCEVTALEECGHCEGRREARGLCPDCLGQKRATCEACQGSGNLSCFGCLISVPSLGGDEPERCKSCRGKGHLDCKACKRGEVKCETCRGGARKRLPCPICVPVFASPCPGCLDDLSGSWRHTADRAERAGRSALALAYRTEGLRREQRADRFVEQRLAQLEAGKVRTNLKRERERIAARIALLLPLVEAAESAASPGSADPKD